MTIVANLFARPRSTSQSDLTATPPTRRSELAARIAEVERLEAAGGDEAAAAASAHLPSTSRRPSGSRVRPVPAQIAALAVVITQGSGVAPPAS